MTRPETSQATRPAGDDARLARPAGAPDHGRPLIWTYYAVIVAGAAAFSIQIFRLPISVYLSDLNIDDSFYYYQIARNFAHGQFSTFDGTHLTNGYHPLWALVLTPIFGLISDPVLALRVVKMFEFAILLAASLLIMASGRKAGWSPIVLVAVPICLFGSPALYSGMETAIQALLFAALMFSLVQLFVDSERTGPALAIGLICGLLPWARLETLSVSIASLTAISIHAFWTDRRHLRAIVFGWAVVGLSFAAYLIYNQLAFGSAVPISGAIKNYWSAAQFATEGGHYLVANAKQYYWAHQGRLVETTVVALVVLGSWAAPAYRSRQMAANHAIDVFVITMAASYFARLAYSVAFVHYSYDNAYYYVTYYIIHALAVPLVFSRTVLLAKSLGPAFRSAYGRASYAMAAIVLLGVAWQAQPWSLPLRWGHDTRSANWLAASFDGANWMNKHLPAGTVIGSPDSGVVGYFSTHRVVNLDGLVNSADFFRAMKAQSTEGWIKRAGITYLANGVRVDETNGCAFIAAASAQTKGYAGACKPVYQGLRFQQGWRGKRDDMQFRVYSFDAKSGT